MPTDSRARNELFRTLQPTVNMCKHVLTEQVDDVPSDRIDVPLNQMMDMLPGLSLRAYKTLAGAKGLGQTLAALHTLPVQFGNRACASSYAQLAVDTAIALVMTLDGFHCELRGDRAGPGRMFGALANANGYWHLLDAGEFVPWAANPGYQFSAEQIVELRRRLYNLPNFRYEDSTGDRSQQIGRDFDMLRAGLEQEAATLVKRNHDRGVATDLIDIKGVAKLVHKSPRTMENRCADWPEPIIPSIGNCAALYSYAELLPVLRKQYPGIKLPDTLPAKA